MAVLDAAEGAAEKSAETGKLEEKFALAEASDPEFASKLRREWETVRNGQHAGTGGVVNSVSGDTSGKFVQARDVRGDISL